MPILGCDECKVLQLLADGEQAEIRIEGNEAVFDDGTRVSRDVLGYLRAESPPLILDAGTYAPGVRGAVAQYVYITDAGRRALARCGEVTEGKTVVVSPEELGGKGE